MFFSDPSNLKHLQDIQKISTDKDCWDNIYSILFLTVHWQKFSKRKQWEIAKFHWVIGDDNFIM
jgi:hypothetical protein